MLKQIKLLSKIQLCNYFGLNEAKYSKDKAKKKRIIGLGAVYIFLGLMIVFYVSAISVVYVKIGIGNLIPTLLFAVSSGIIFFFSMFRAGSTIYNMQTYEKEISLPIKPQVIVLSRFFNMYISNLLFSFLVMIPGSIVYSVFIKPEPTYYLIITISLFFLPLVPITAATALGALIYGLSSRMRHKNIVSIIISMTLTVAILLLSMSKSLFEKISTEQAFQNLSEVLNQKINEIYPPAILFNKAIINYDILSFLLFIVISLSVFCFFVYIIEKNFVPVCTALSSSASKRNYVVGKQIANSPIKALYKKELKRYFSSSIYVMNTSIGYIMMLILAIALTVMGTEKVDALLGISGVVVKYLPFLLSAISVISSTTASSISIEGKQWWIIKSLPVNQKQVYISKMLVNLTVALPLYTVSEIIICFGAGFSFVENIWNIIIPFVYIIFITVIGLAVNIKMPLFNWESETVVVKQSGATAISMLCGFISVLIPVVIIILLKTVNQNILYGIIIAILALITFMVFQKTEKKELINIE